MKVKLTTGRITDVGAQQIGLVLEVDDAEGKRMLAAGQCELVEAAVAGGNVENAARNFKPNARG